MRFGPVPVSQAEGAILAHSVQLKARRLRKGAVLTPDHLAQLTEAGIPEVTVARLDAEDVHEDAAALALAEALVPNPEAAHVALGPATTGRVNLHAAALGIAEIDAEAIHAVNAIDPMITVATVPLWQRMTLKGLMATVKIISYAVPQDALSRAVTAAQGAISLRPTRLRTAHLVQTVVDGQGPGKGYDAIANRCAALGVELGPQSVARHEVAPLAQALLATDAELLLILTGSATSDSRDVAPEAVRAAGGEVLHFGMPVDPGNLLFVGRIGTRPVIGLPGCARSPALNGADWVLERIACGLDVTPTDIAAMGVGGLLKEIPVRGRLRDP